MSKLDKIIALMDAHFFKNLKEICEIPVHKAAIEAIINDTVWNKNLNAAPRDGKQYLFQQGKSFGFRCVLMSYSNDRGWEDDECVCYLQEDLIAWMPLPTVEGV